MGANLDQFQDRSFGAQGAVVCTGTDPVVGRFYAIQAVADTQFATINASDFALDTDSFSIPAGIIIYGTFNGFALASGAVVAYKR